MAASDLRDLPAPATPAAPRRSLALRRHQLLRLSGAGWERVLAAPWDDEARACLAWWAGRGLPLVVTRQPGTGDQGNRIATGLPAPTRFGRRRLALSVGPDDVMFFDEFPPPAAATRLLGRDLVDDWARLLSALAAKDCAARLYGGYGWQALTRLVYVHAGSDIDLLLPVDSAAHADEVAHALATAAWRGPRLDGELLFADGAGVAWREWHAHRQGRAARVLVKRLHGVALEAPAACAA